MALKHPLKQFGDYRQYPYPPTVEELAAELAAEQQAHAQTRLQLDVARVHVNALRKRLESAFLPPPVRVAGRLALTGTGRTPFDAGVRTAHSGLPN